MKQNESVGAIIRSINLLLLLLSYSLHRWESTVVQCVPCSFLSSSLFFLSCSSYFFILITPSYILYLTLLISSLTSSHVSPSLALFSSSSSSSPHKIWRMDHLQSRSLCGRMKVKMNMRLRMKSRNKHKHQHYDEKRVKMRMRLNQWLSCHTAGHCESVSQAISFLSLSCVWCYSARDVPRYPWFPDTRSSLPSLSFFSFSQLHSDLQSCPCLFNYSDFPVGCAVQLHCPHFHWSPSVSLVRHLITLSFSLSAITVAAAALTAPAVVCWRSLIIIWSIYCEE